MFCGGSQQVSGFCIKKLFVSKTDCKLKSRTQEVRDRALVQNQNRLQWLHGEKSLRKTGKALAEKNWIQDYSHLKAYTLDIYSLSELNLAQVWSKYTLRTGQGQQSKHGVWKASFVASYWRQACNQPVGCRAALLLLWFVQQLPGQCSGSWATTAPWAVRTTETANLLALLAVCRGQATLL